MAETHPLSENRLLASLPPEFGRELAPEMEKIRLELKQSVYEPLQPIEHVYFPTDGVISMLADVEEEPSVEVATVGKEGMVGLPLFLGATVTPGRSFSQIPGAAYRMTAAAFQRAIASDGPLTRRLHRYTQALMIQISQGTACNRIHSIEQRCARWLLLTRDRVGADEFLLTQEFLGQMLGVRRATVSEVAGRMQEAGFITYSRGVIRICNREGLESVSCRCYAVIRDEYERMLAA
jgi:CRP-like cAMP-binding protein